VCEPLGGRPLSAQVGLLAPFAASAAPRGRRRGGALVAKRPWAVGDNARHPLKLDLKRQKYPPYTPRRWPNCGAPTRCGTVAEFIDFRRRH